MESHTQGAFWRRRLNSSNTAFRAGWLVAVVGALLPYSVLSQQPPPPLPLPALPAQPPVPAAASSDLFPGAVPPSAPQTNDPGLLPSVPLFGPQSGGVANPESISPPPTAVAAATPGANLPPQNGRPPPNGLPPQSNQNGGISESDIRAYVVEDVDLTPVQTAPDGAIWERHAPLAFHKAKTLQRPLLLLFTAQWNASCQKLSEEVFTSKTFNSFAKEKCVICFVDYPQNMNKATDGMRRVKEKFQVRGYPTLLIFDPDGNVVQQVSGYRPGRPVAYFNELFSIVDPLSIHLEGRKKQLMKEGFRDWRSNSGATVFATFVSHNFEKAMLRGPAGDRWVFPIVTLSPSDQDLVKSFPSFEEMQQATGGRAAEVIGR